MSEDTGVTALGGKGGGERKLRRGGGVIEKGRRKLRGEGGFPVLVPMVIDDIFKPGKTQLRSASTEMIHSIHNNRDEA